MERLRGGDANIDTDELAGEELETREREQGRGRKTLNLIEKSGGLGGDAGVENSQVKTEQRRRAEAIVAQYRGEVFDNVDMEEVSRVTSEWVEKIDEKDLLELYDELEKDNRVGALKVVQYFADLLDLEKTPQVEFIDKQSTSVGSARRRPGLPDLLKLNLHDNVGGPSLLMETIAHESWHSRQHMLEGYLLESNMAKIAEMPQYFRDNRVLLYVINDSNYADAKDDVELYRKQLVEAEAYTFQELGGKMNILRQKECERIREMYPELFSPDSKEAVEAEINRVLRGWNPARFLGDVGVRNFLELEQKGGSEFEDVVGGILSALSGDFGLKDTVRIEISDDVETEAEWGMRQVALNKTEMMKKDFYQNFRDLLTQVWWLKQMDEFYDVQSEHGKLYRTSAFYNMYKRKGDMESDFIIDEAMGLADTMVDVVREQGGKEYIERLPLMSRVERRLRNRREEKFPLSKKYDIRYSAKKMVR